MLIRVFSDIHLDFDVGKNHKDFHPALLWMPEQLAEDSQTILVLAGDLWHSKKYFVFMNQSWLSNVSKRFHSVIVVLGNHDFWGGNISFEYNFFNQQVKEQQLANVHLLQNSTISIGDCKFLGGTLWTDYNNQDPDTKNYYKTGYTKDYKFIRSGIIYKKITPDIIIKEHIKTKKYIFDNATRDCIDQKVWVITHHPPSFLSLSASSKNSLERGFYASDLDMLISESDIDVWVHGHQHRNLDYFISNTRILANPRGYPGEKIAFNSKHRVNSSGDMI